VSEGQETGLSLDSVVRRFGDSERALEEIRGRLSSLADSAETSEGAAGALREAAESVRGFANSAEATAAELQAAVGQAKTVMEKSAELLEGNALGSLERSLSDLAQLVRESGEALEKRLGEIETRMNQLDRVYAVLPNRWKKSQA
jgi:DNA repair ATPase RecN